MQDAIEWLAQLDDIGDLGVFSDFDGTLAPIVDRPGDARPLAGITELLEEIGSHLPAGVISGRGLDDIVERVGAEGIYYAGSHGLELQLADGTRSHAGELDEWLPDLDRQQEWLEDRFAEAPRVEIERKRFAIAVHFRRRPEAREIVETAVDEAAQQAGRALNVVAGKMVRELRPDVDLDKGTALRAMLELVDPRGLLRPVYLGDDTTDEDVFEEIRDDGIGIVVADEGGETAARYRLEDPEAVREFLGLIADRLRD